MDRCFVVEVDNLTHGSWRIVRVDIYSKLDGTLRLLTLCRRTSQDRFHVHWRWVSGLRAYQKLMIEEGPR